MKFKFYHTIYVKRINNEEIHIEDKNEANYVYVLMYNGEYACAKEFKYPEQEYEMSEYIRALEWAYNMGKQHRSLEVRDLLNSLIEVQHE